MERLSPIPTEEQPVPGTTGTSSLRVTVYSLLALLLAAGGWVRFNDQIASVSPALAGPAAGAAAEVADAGAIRQLLELGMLPQATAPAAVAALGLPPADAAAMTDALRRDRLRLVQLPLFDAGMSAPGDALTGRMVEVSSGGYTRLVRLSRQPVLVTLPIDRVGTVSFRIPANDTGSEALGIGAFTLTGPMHLPDISQGQELDVGVVAQ